MNNGLKAPVVSRIAPTPSGFLHEGNAFSFVLTWLLVRASGGRLILRIDDIDAARKRPDYVEDIFRTLEWLGLDFDLGPQGPGDFEKNFSQLHRLELYQEVLQELLQLPGLIYACKCSRKEVQQLSHNRLYPGTCRKIALPLNRKNCALRIYLPERVEVSFQELLGGPVAERLPIGQQMGDFVIWKKDGLPAYQLVSLADDLDYGVNLLVRGMDLRESTAAQIYMANCLREARGRFREPAVHFGNSRFLHHPLVLDQFGEKLSKSKGAASVMEMRKSGIGPSIIYSRVSRFMGLTGKPDQNLEDLLESFKESGFYQMIKKELR